MGELAFLKNISHGYNPSFIRFPISQSSSSSLNLIDLRKFPKITAQCTPIPVIQTEGPQIDCLTGYETSNTPPPFASVQPEPPNGKPSTEGEGPFDKLAARSLLYVTSPCYRFETLILTNTGLTVPLLTFLFGAGQSI